VVKYRGSCHCGKVRFEVADAGELTQLVECNCSHCGRKGYLMWFIDSARLRVEGQDGLTTYLFNKHNIRHQFCSTCGCAPFGIGQNRAEGKAAINARCLEDLDLKALPVKQVDGKNL
jgi:hypothetical protein